MLFQQGENVLLKSVLTSEIRIVLTVPTAETLAFPGTYSEGCNHFLPVRHPTSPFFRTLGNILCVAVFLRNYRKSSTKKYSFDLDLGILVPALSAIPARPALGFPYISARFRWRILSNPGKRPERGTYIVQGRK